MWVELGFFRWTELGNLVSQSVSFTVCYCLLVDSSRRVTWSPSGSGGVQPVKSDLGSHFGFTIH